MKMQTIGQLARRAGMRTSALRYYEEQGLLAPAGRTDAGYRLYAPEAEQTLYFIQRAQRIGFSLADIHALLQSFQEGNLSDETVMAIAEERALDLERRLTGLLALRHEMSLLLLELREGVRPAASVTTESLFDRLVDRVCAGPQSPLQADAILDWLFERTRCALAPAETRASLRALRGQHMHIWQEGDTYQVLVVSDDPAILAAMQALARLEATCQAHPPPQLHGHKEGYLFTARGKNAFIFARLFLALEQE